MYGPLQVHCGVAHTRLADMGVGTEVMRGSEKGATHDGHNGTRGGGGDPSAVLQATARVWPPSLFEQAGTRRFEVGVYLAHAVTVDQVSDS